MRIFKESGVGGSREKSDTDKIIVFYAVLRQTSLRVEATKI